MRAIVLLVAALACAGCAPSIKRIGYAEPARPAPDCDMQFARPDQAAGHSFQKLGTIKVEHRGLTLDCRESALLEIISAETCALGGNLAVVRNGNAPDPHDVCYRLEADLYRADTVPLAKYASNGYDNPVAISRRSERFSEQLSRDLAVVMASVIFVLATGPLLPAVPLP
jgi:hypothetical protein